MIENFITAFIVYFVVIDPVGTAPIFLAVTTHLDTRQKIRTALEGTFVAGAIMLFFALCGVWILHYLNISLTAFRLAGGIILLLVALDMFANKRQARREHGNDTISTDDSARFFRQIASLRQRLRLIAIIQTCSSLAFFLNLSAMISLYFGIDSLGSWLFFLSIVLMVAAMIQFTIEIQIANSTIDVHLSDLEKHQEWHDYLATSKARGKKSRKVIPSPPPHPAG